MEQTHKNGTKTQQCNIHIKMEQRHKMSQMGIGLQVNKAKIKSRKEEFCKIWKFGCRKSINVESSNFQKFNPNSH